MITLDYEMVLKFLREHAPQVKNFTFDQNFTGRITCYERKDKGPEGYDLIQHEFANFEELKAYYGRSPVKKSVSKRSAVRRVVKKSSDIVKKVVARRKPAKK